MLGILACGGVTEAQDCMRWVERQDVGNPGPQSRHCMAYDRDLGVTLLFTSDLSADLWQYDGTNWVKLTVTGPRPADRLDAALAYDPVRRAAILSGGFGRAANGALGDTWAFTRTGPAQGRWTRQADLVGSDYRVVISFAEGGARSNHRMVFDAAQGAVVAFGGDAPMKVFYAGESDDGVYSSASRLLWAGGDWRREGFEYPIDQDLEAETLSEFAMAYDGIRKQVLLHGGRRTVFVRADKAVLGYDGLSIVGTNGLKRLATRAGRLAHRMVHDSRRDRYVVFGGAVLRGGDNPTGLTEYETTLPYLEIDPKQPGYPHVVPTTPSSIPRARVYHDMVYDERRGVTVMYGGQSISTLTQEDPAMRETWELRPLLALSRDLPSQVEACATSTGELSPALTLAVEASSPGGVTYQWRMRRGEYRWADNPSTEPFRTLRIGDPGTWEVVLTDGCGNSITSSPCLVKVWTSPTIRTAPVSQHVCPGESVETRVVPGTDSLNRLLEQWLDGDPERPVRFQWFRVGLHPTGSASASVASVPIQGATSSVLRFESFQPEDNGYYRCRLSNACGETFTEAVELTAGAWIRRHPATITNDVCTATSLEVLASGKGSLRYQWRRNGDLLSVSDPRIVGANQSRLVFASLRYLDDAAYDCIVSDTCNSVTSLVAGLGVVPNPPFLWVDTNGPAARQNHAMVYDPARGVSVMFGGLVQAQTAAEAYPRDTWEYDGTRWVRRNTVTAPPGRVDFGMAFDRHRGRVVLFGGMTNNAFGGSAPSGETWEYNGVNWEQRFPGTSPAPRHGHAMFYDPVHRVTTLYGGDTQLVNPRAGDVWTWDGTTWTRREISGERPLFGGQYGSPPRPQMIWDERRGYAVLPPQVNNAPGGSHVTWTWNGTNWNAIPTPFLGFGVSPAQTGTGYGLVYDRYRGEVIYWSGTSYDQDYVWRWNGATWRRDNVSLFVGFHINAASTYDERRNSVVMFGGRYSGNAIPGQAEPGLSARTFERLLADEPVVLRPPSVVEDRSNGRLEVHLVVAGVGPMTYEWQRDGVKLVEAFPYSGTTNAVLRVDRGLIQDAGRYRCVVRAKCGQVTTRATTLAGVLDSSGLVLSLTSAPVEGRPGLSLAWEGTGVVLERAISPAGPWSVVTGAKSPYAPALNEPAGFFRLRAP